MCYRSHKARLSGPPKSHRLDAPSSSASVAPPPLPLSFTTAPHVRSYKTPPPPPVATPPPNTKAESADFMPTTNGAEATTEDICSADTDSSNIQTAACVSHDRVLPTTRSVPNRVRASSDATSVEGSPQSVQSVGNNRSLEVVDLCSPNTNQPASVPELSSPVSGRIPNVWNDTQSQRNKAASGSSFRNSMNEGRDSGAAKSRTAAFYSRKRLSSRQSSSSTGLSSVTRINSGSRNGDLGATSSGLTPSLDHGSSFASDCIHTSVIQQARPRRSNGDEGTSHSFDAFQNTGARQFNSSSFDSNSATESPSRTESHPVIGNSPPPLLSQLHSLFDESLSAATPVPPLLSNSLDHRQLAPPSASSLTNDHSYSLVNQLTTHLSPNDTRITEHSYSLASIGAMEAPPSSSHASRLPLRRSNRLSTRLRPYSFSNQLQRAPNSSSPIIVSDPTELSRTGATQRSTPGAPYNPIVIDHQANLEHSSPSPFRDRLRAASHQQSLTDDLFPNRVHFHLFHPSVGSNNSSSQQPLSNQLGVNSSPHQATPVIDNELRILLQDHRGNNLPDYTFQSSSLRNDRQLFPSSYSVTNPPPSSSAIHHHTRSSDPSNSISSGNEDEPTFSISIRRSPDVSIGASHRTAGTDGGSGGSTQENSLNGATRIDPPFVPPFIAPTNSRQRRRAALNRSAFMSDDPLPNFHDAMYDGIQSNRTSEHLWDEEELSRNLEFIDNISRRRQHRGTGPRYNERASSEIHQSGSSEVTVPGSSQNENEAVQHHLSSENSTNTRRLRRVLHRREFSGSHSSAPSAPSLEHIINMASRRSQSGSNPGNSQPVHPSLNLGSMPTIREHSSTSSSSSPPPPPNGTTLNSSPSHQTVSGSHSPPPTQAEVIVVDSDSDSDEVRIYSTITFKILGCKNI